MGLARAAIAVFALLLTGCAGRPPAIEPAAARAEVIATERAFARTMADRDQAGFAALIADDAVFFTGPQPLRGKPAVLAWWARYYVGASAPFAWEPEEVEVSASGDLALSSGPVRDADGTLIARFTSIWRRRGGSGWEIVFDRGNPVSPAPATAVPPSRDKAHGNLFDDPFEQVTAGLATCAPPQGPDITLAEMRAEAHWRAERGTSCYLAGRCRLPNAYLYDREIIPRVRKAILADGRFNDTSVWVEGQRRIVWLKGCVATRTQAGAIEELVRRIDDVEGVVNELTVMPN